MHDLHTGLRLENREALIVPVLLSPHKMISQCFLAALSVLGLSAHQQPVECVVKSEGEKGKDAAAAREGEGGGGAAHYPPIKAGHYLLDRLGLMWKDGEDGGGNM